MENTLLTAPNEPTVHSEEVAEQIEKNQAAIQLLQSWFDEDEQEQRETLLLLQVALDEDRLSDRLLFS